jgi:enediyne biosynthesis protein E4
VGDLNADGFPDIVSVSSFDRPEPVPLVRYPVSFIYGSPFDATAVFVPEFSRDPHPGHEGGFLWGGPLFDYPDGTLSVEINSGSNGNGWVEVLTLGTVGLTSRGRVNRDGIGAVVRLAPNHGKAVMRPVLGGSSDASQDRLATTFGLGSAQSGTVDVLWPGGVRNRLYDVRPSERIALPEIPCDFTRDWGGHSQYRACVETALNELVACGVLNQSLRARFLSSALRAFADSQ